jgi:tetratricopeptide (TPR) repeat protein
VRQQEFLSALWIINELKCNIGRIQLLNIRLWGVRAMSSLMSSFNTLIAVLVGVTVVVALLSVVALRTYRERRARKRNEELAEQVKKQLADLRNSRPSHQQRVDQGNNDIEDTGHEASQRVKKSIGQSASQEQGTVGQDAHQRRATEAEPWATFQLGSIFDRQGKCARAVEAYQQVLDSGHQEAAPRAAFNLGILFEERGEYDLAEEAYQRAIASEHSEWAPKAAFDLGMLFEEREEYDRAEEAYQQAINSGHPEVAPKGMHNLRGLPMRFPQRIRKG